MVKRRAEKKTKDKVAARTTGRPRAKSQALPGMEDHAIKPLEEIAEQYVDIRDHRMELTEQEHTLKVTGIKLMKKYGKTVYRHNGVELTLLTGEDDLKVRVKKSGDADDEPGGLDTDDDAAPGGEDLKIADVQQTDERRRAVDDEPNDTGE